MVFGALVLPGQAAAGKAYSAEAGSPDTSLFYTSSDLYQIAESYGEIGRQAYVRARFTFDLAFPFVYGLFFSASSSWLLGKSISPGSSWRMLNLIPLAGVGFDLLENISAALVIGRYPLRSPLAAALAPIFTPVKWLFVGGSFALLLFGLWLLVFGKKA